MAILQAVETVIVRSSLEDRTTDQSGLASAGYNGRFRKALWD